MKKLKLLILFSILSVSSVFAAYQIKNVQYNYQQRRIVPLNSELVITFDYTSNVKNVTIRLDPFYLDEAVSGLTVSPDLVFNSKSGSGSFTISSNSDITIDKLKFRFYKTISNELKKTRTQDASFRFADNAVGYFDIQNGRTASYEVGSSAYIYFATSHLLDGSIEIYPMYQGVIGNSRLGQNYHTQHNAGSHFLLDTLHFNEPMKIDALIIGLITEGGPVYLGHLPVDITVYEKNIDLNLNVIDFHTIEGTITNNGSLSYEDWHLSLILDSMDIASSTNIGVTKIGGTTVLYPLSTDTLEPGEVIEFTLSPTVEIPCILRPIHNAHFNMQPVVNLAVNDERGLETDFVTITVYPNPTSDYANICFSLEQAGYTEVAVYNRYGGPVKTLSNQNLGAGLHEILWNLTDYSNSAIPDGIYYIVVSANGALNYTEIVVAR